MRAVYVPCRSSGKGRSQGCEFDLSTEYLMDVFSHDFAVNKF